MDMEILEERKRELRRMRAGLSTSAIREHIFGSEPELYKTTPEYQHSIEHGLCFDTRIGFERQGGGMLTHSTTAEQREQEREATRRCGPSLNELFDRDFAVWKKTVGKATAENRLRDWNNHVRSTEVANKAGGLITENEARDLIVSLPLQKAGKRKIRQICETLARRLTKTGFRTDNPFDDVKIPKDRITAQRIKFYSLAEFSRLVAAATGQLKDVLRVGGNTGLRPDEIRWLRWEDLDLEAKRMTVCRTSNGAVKGGEPKTVDLLPGAIEAFQAIDRHPSGYVFPSKLGKPRNRQAEFGLRRLCESLGIEYKGLYGLRHFFAVMLATGGFGVQFTRKEAATLMRHEGMASIDVYYALTDDHIAEKAKDCRPLELLQDTLV
ncbi:MAG: tyrosine-type recombinase/integrase [Myxococcales bacterium]|nr:tyrosine-type recombinase/integrase [Myxococcales bacterium]